MITFKNLLVWSWHTIIWSLNCRNWNAQGFLKFGLIRASQFLHCLKTNTCIWVTKIKIFLISLHQYGLKMSCTTYLNFYIFFRLLENIKDSYEAKKKPLNIHIYVWCLEIFQNFFIKKNLNHMQNKYISVHQLFIYLCHKEGMESRQTVHQVFCVSFSITGSLTNFILIVIVMYRDLFRQSRFVFFLNFLVCNFLMSFVCLPFWTFFAYLPEAAMESSTLCRL